MGVIKTKYGNATYRKLHNIIEVLFTEDYIEIPKGVSNIKSWVDPKELDVKEFIPISYKVDEESVKKDVIISDFFVNNSHYVQITHQFQYKVKGTI